MKRDYLYGTKYCDDRSAGSTQNAPIRNGIATTTSKMVAGLTFACVVAVAISSPLVKKTENCLRSLYRC